ncbi:MAG TPA: hypothetical protein VGL99_31545 [Chloroflexota bacterium]|jgi:hypothetical protein
MRRLLWLLPALIVVACVRPLTQPIAGSQERLLLATDTGLQVVDPAARRVLFTARSAVPSTDLARLFAVRDHTVAVLDAASGGPIAVLPLPDGLAPAVVSTSGLRLALAEPRDGGANPWLPAARARTRITIADPSGVVAPRELDLDGNFEPEAFSSDDRSLFVLEYLPPLAPDRYRVRQVELTSGAVVPLVDRFKRVPIPNEETMRGQGRQQVAAPDASRLYTLYTHQPDHLHGRDLAAGLGTARGDVHAFVHVLSLNEGWAYCVDLPLPFGVGPASAQALAISPDGARVTVVDRTSGALAAISTNTLDVTLNVPGTPDAWADRGLASAHYSPDGSTLYVAGGSELLALDGASLAVRSRWPVAASMNGLAVSPDGQRLYLGLEGRVSVLDATTGRELRSIAVPELRALKSVASAAPRT